jgi:hypothetical protein
MALIQTIWHGTREFLVWLTSISDFWKPLWASVAGALAGAAAAFQFEHQRRERARIRDELGQCHALHMNVVHMASILRDLQEQLFGEVESKPKRWNEIGILNGAPRHGPEFAFKEYAFLLDGSDTKSPAPTLLSRISTATTNFESNLEWLHARNALWTRGAELESALGIAMGRDVIGINNQLEDVSRNMEQFTEWLRESVPESIEELEAIQPLLHQVLHARYPKQQFIMSKPKDGAPERSGV